MQSQEEEIDLLPALPREWSAGSICGLRARGGFTVDLQWADGRLTSATIHSLEGSPCRVRYDSITKELTLGRNESMTLNGNLMPSN
jgi:alpha-L-fucosidase 2